MGSNFFEPEKITYKEEGFNDYLIREFDFARVLDAKETLAGSPTQISLPGGDITWPKFEIPPSSPYAEGNVRGIGIMTIGGTLSNGTDVALPNLYVTKSCIAYELIASVKTITSGTIIFTVNVNGIAVGTVLVTSADTLFGTPISISLSPDDSITVDVSGTYSASDASIGIRIKQGTEV